MALQIFALILFSVTCYIQVVIVGVFEGLTAVSTTRCWFCLGSKYLT